MKRALLWLLLLTLGGCAMHPPIVLPPDLQRQLPPRHELTRTPFFSQDAYQCGPASLAMVMDYYGRDLKPQQLTPWVFTPDAKGSFPAEMDAVARQQGFISYPIDRFDDLLQEVAAGHPVLVLQNLGLSWYTRWHFAVVIGFDRQSRTLILRSGDLARRQTGFDLFETTWARSEHWARVIVPPDRLPATAQARPYLQAAADLDQTGPESAAQQAFKTALSRWPSDPVARFGLASSLLKRNRFAAAQQQFETLLKQQPKMASAWNNYAYALKGNHCPASALAAARCGAALAPENPAIANSVQELSTTEQDEKHCHALTCPTTH